LRQAAFSSGLVAINVIGLKADIAETTEAITELAADAKKFAGEIPNYRLHVDLNRIGSTGGNISIGKIDATAPRGAGILDDVARRNVWKLDDRARGIQIERHLTATEYKDWWNIGAEHGGFFPLIDFQKDLTVVSLKSVNTTGGTWLGRMQDHIAEFARRRPRINGVPAQNAVLDLRVQPGGLNDAASLIEFGRQRGITVIIKEF